MAYKISKGRPKKIPENYFENREIKELRVKYKGKRVPFFEAERVATRNFLSVGKLTHKKNGLVYYKDEIVKIKKVEKKGIYVQTYHRDKEDFLVPNKRLKFIPEKEVEHQIYPITYPQTSVGVISPYNMATMPEY